MNLLLFFRIFLSCFCLLEATAPASAQLYCPNNINFELGNLTHWSFDTGYNNGASGITSSPIPAPIGNRDSLTSTNDTDFYGGFKIVDPVGGAYSLRLGNSKTGAEVDIARYTFTIPVTVNNYSLTYRYAVVFQDPSHQPYEQPFFRVRVYNPTTNIPINCASFSYTAKSNLPGFIKSNQGNPLIPVYYKPWSPVSLNLSGHAGETLVLEFTSSDCSLTGHFGYAYVDVSCGLFSIYNPDSNGCRYTTRLSAPSGFQTYTWYDSSFSKIIDSGQHITIAPPATLTKFNVVFLPYPGYGCPDTLSVRTFSRKPLTIDAGPDTSVCVGGRVALQASGGQRYEWSPDSTLSCAVCASPLAAPIVRTIYTVLGNDSTGCSGIDTIVVSSSRIVIDAGADTLACIGSSVMLHPSGALTYVWLPDSSLSCWRCTNPISVPLSDMMYFVTGTDSSGCIATDSLAVNIIGHVPVGVNPTENICLGDSMRLGASGGIAWHWLPPVANNADSPNPFVRPAASTVYQVAITENECFIDTLLQQVIVNGPPIVSLGPDPEGLVGETITLRADVNMPSSISWRPQLGLSCYSCPVTQHTILANTTYTVVARNDFGCLATDTINISQVCAQGAFYFPNTFTPNGDGANDYFYPRGQSSAMVQYFRIYDRWGELVFSASNFHQNEQKAGWNGSYKNAPAQPGVYVYVMGIICELGKNIELTGDISLIR